MSETSKPISQRVNDQASAYELANVQKPFKDVELAFINDSQLEIAQQVALMGLAKIEESEEQKQSEHKSELNPERISQIASESVFAAHTWMLQASEIPDEKRDGGHGFTSVFNHGKWADNRLRVQMRLENDVDLMDGFIDAGVIELVTVYIASENTKFKKVNSTSKKPEDGVVAIHYQTLTREGSDKEHRLKYSHLDGFSRPGNYLNVLMYLPKSDADELMTAVRKDPNVIRQLVDVQMREQIGADQSWNQAKPPYKEWEEINSGVSRIAIRSDNNQGVESSEIVKFKTND